MTLESLLQSFGLSKSEATVYLAALTEEYMTAGQIAEHAGVKRSTVYYTLDHLVEKGLIATAGSKVMKFKAEPAEQLFILLERKRSELKFLKKKLEQLIDDFPSKDKNPTGPPGVSFFKGSEGLKALGEKMLNCRSKVIYTIGAPFSEIEATDLEFISGLLERRAKKGIITKSIWQDSPTKEILEDNKKFLRDVRIAPDLLRSQSKSMISIVDNDVIIINFLPELVGLSFSSAAFSSTQKGIWDVIWEQSTPFVD